MPPVKDMGLFESIIHHYRESKRNAELEQAIAEGRGWWDPSTGFYEGRSEVLKPHVFVCVVCHEDVTNQEMRDHLRSSKRHLLFKDAFDLWRLRQQPTIQKQVLAGHEVVVMGERQDFFGVNERVRITDRVHRRVNYYNQSSPASTRRELPPGGARPEVRPVYKWITVPNPDYKPDTKG